MKNWKDDPEAVAWWEEHGHEVPGVVKDVEENRITTAGGERRYRQVRSLEARNIMGNRRVEYGESGKFLPLMGNVGTHDDEDPAREAHNARVERALARLPESQADLLRARFILGLSWEELRNGDESRQAVYARIKRARAAFERLWEAM